MFKVCVQSKTKRISHARSWKKGKYKLIHNHSSCFRTKIKIIENKSNQKDCKLYTIVYCVWTVKTILIIFRMILNPVFGRSSCGSLQYQLLYSLSAQELIREPLQQTLWVSHLDSEVYGYTETAIGKYWGFFSKYVTGVSSPAILPLCTLCLWRQAF